MPHQLCGANRVAKKEKKKKENEKEKFPKCLSTGLTNTSVVFVPLETNKCTI